MPSAKCYDSSEPGFMDRIVIAGLPTGLLRAYGAEEHAQRGYDGEEAHTCQTWHAPTVFFATSREPCFETTRKPFCEASRLDP
jgi:hypothetical protein